MMDDACVRARGIVWGSFFLHLVQRMGRLWDMVRSAFGQWRTWGLREARAVRAARRSVEDRAAEVARGIEQYQADVLGDVGAAVAAASAVRSASPPPSPSPSNSEAADAGGKGGAGDGAGAEATLHRMAQLNGAMERLRSRVDGGQAHMAQLKQAATTAGPPGSGRGG